MSNIRCLNKLIPYVNCICFMYSSKPVDDYLYSSAPRPLEYPCKMAPVKYDIKPNLGLPPFLKIYK